MGQRYMCANKEIHTDKRNFIMATYQNTTSQAFGATLILKAVNVLENSFASLNSWNKTRKTKAELSKLTTRELADIGLTRGEINSI
jgi:uncharacterized protein YjiS (DUF1127 family)